MQNDITPSSEYPRDIFTITGISHSRKGRTYYTAKCSACGYEIVQPRYRIVGARSSPCPQCESKRFRDSGAATPDWAMELGFDENFWSRFWPKINKNGPVPEHCPELGQCWIWTAGVNGNGYGSLASNISNGNHTMISTHRASWILHNGRVLDVSEWVLHKCDTPRCCRPEHLFLGDGKDNSDDMINKGRSVHPAGEDHPNAILTDSQVVDIRSMYSTGHYTYRELGALFNCAPSNIGMIMQGRARHTNK